MPFCNFCDALWLFVLTVCNRRVDPIVALFYDESFLESMSLFFNEFCLESEKKMEKMLHIVGVKKVIISFSISVEKDGA